MSHNIAPEVPFRIAISDDKLSFLRRKLELAVFPDELEDSGREYGAPLADIQRLVARWKDGFDWRAQEAKLNNDLPQFTRDIEVSEHGTLSIHYVHKQSEVKNAIPLLFVHGWPGSFIEVQKILPLLTAASAEHPSFHVVALSLPGYGFSEAPHKQGFTGAKYAEVGNKLMLSLGYDKYVTQGGDWGSLITRRIAMDYGGKHSMAWHTNFPICEAPRFTSQPLLYLSSLLSPLTPAEKAGVERSQWFEKHGRGYNHEQSTQPQTLGYALSDSPVGLLGWIVEKLYNWTDDYPWEDDEILTWVSIYWFSRAGPTASLRIYYEINKAAERSVPLSKLPKIPLGASFFPKELRHVPKKWRQNAGNLVFQADHTSGGHFAAHEKPEELVGDLRKMFGKGGPVFGVVPNKTGYA